MLKTLITTVAFAMAASAAAAADQTDPYESPIAQCIRDNAAKVEATVPDINQAVDFLVGKVCAVQIAEHNADRTKLVQQKAAERMEKMCDAQAAKDSAKPDTTKTDDSKPAAPAAPDYCAIMRNASAMVVQPLPYDPWTSGLLVGTNNPPAAVALAAQTLINLRAARKHHDN